MQGFAYEREAAEGRPAPDGLAASDAAAYMALRALYMQYSAGLIDREAARAEKAEIAKAYAALRSREEFLMRESDALRGRIGAASEAYRREPTRSNADRLYAAFWGLPEGWRDGTE